jgi:hypothetical protein
MVNIILESFFTILITVVVVAIVIGPPELLRRLLRVSDRYTYLLFVAWSFILTALVVYAIVAPYRSSGVVPGIGEKIIAGSMLLGLASYGFYEIVKRVFGSSWSSIKAAR